jgi:hypothetical protein
VLEGALRATADPETKSDIERMLKVVQGRIASHNR